MYTKSGTRPRHSQIGSLGCKRFWLVLCFYQSPALTALMNWADEPATWKQLKLLKQLGHHPDHPLTKTAASDLIVSLGGRQESQETLEEQNIRQMKERGAAYHLRVTV